MKTYTITITDEEDKALLTDIINVEEWLGNVLREKARRVTDAIVAERTDRQPQKLSAEDKAAVIRAAELKTAAARLTEFMAKPQ